MADQLNPLAQEVDPPAQLGSNAEKSKLVQQEFFLLLHAFKCMCSEDTKRFKNTYSWSLVLAAANRYSTCSLPQCETFKNLLRHMTSCTAGETCTVPHCSSTREIILHFKHCARSDCPLCTSCKKGDVHFPRTPLSLKYLCKQAVCEIIGSNRIEECVDSLELPLTLKAYLRQKSKNNK